MGETTASTLAKVCAGAVPVIAGLVAAAFLIPPTVGYLERQVLLFAWGVGGILIAEVLLFEARFPRALSALGLVPPHRKAAFVALIVSLPMWLFVPVYGLITGMTVSLNPEWASLLLGVVLVNGIAEEIIHRAFIFGHLRRVSSFVRATAISALIFGLQHAYLIFTIGPLPGSVSVLLALGLAFPLALLYESGGNSIAGPAILHTSSNAPMMLFVQGDTVAEVILLHMAVVFVSMYASFAFLPWLRFLSARRNT